MNPLSDYEHSEDELAIRQHYQSIQAADTAQREAILDRWQQDPLPLPAATRRPFRARAVAMAAVALTLLAVLTAWEFKTTGQVYGADDLPERLTQVDSFRMTGWQNVENIGGANLPPTRLPFEMIVKRPGRYRHSFNAVSQNGNKQTIITGFRTCDGRHEAMQNDTSKEYFQVPVGPLDAVLKTEQLAQGTAMLMLLGPPDAHYKLMGKETVKGSPCDLYSASFEESSEIRLWIDPVTGWPIRIAVEMVNGAGKRVPMIEIVDVVINGELPDSLFSLSPPEGYVDLLSKLSPPPPSDASNAAPAHPQLPEIAVQSTSSAHSNDQSLEVWNGFLLTTDSALIVWKRTTPQPGQGGTLDWLSGIKLVYENGSASRPLNHHWVRPPQDKQWLWSIVKTADGQPFDRGMVQMTYRAGRGRLNLPIVPLLFSDEKFEQIIQAAEKSLPVPVPGEPLTLKALRAMAGQLK